MTSDEEAKYKALAEETCEKLHEAIDVLMTGLVMPVKDDIQSMVICLQATHSVLLTHAGIVERRLALMSPSQEGRLISDRENFLRDGYKIADAAVEMLMLVRNKKN